MLFFPVSFSPHEVLVYDTMYIYKSSRSLLIALEGWLHQGLGYKLLEIGKEYNAQLDRLLCCVLLAVQEHTINDV